MLRKLYPWLLPLIVAGLLVLSFTVAERIRSNTPEGKFNRVRIGMDRETVRRILGKPAPPYLPQRDEWVLGGFLVTVHYDDENRMTSRMMGIAVP